MVEQNPHDDSLEAELASFRARPISPEMRQRINVELTRRPIRRASAVAVFAAAACVVLGFVLSHKNTNIDHSRISPTVAIVKMPSPPTVMDYQRAFARSSEALDELLAKPAGREQSSDVREAEPVRAFSRDLDALTHSNGDSL